MKLFCIIIMICVSDAVFHIFEPVNSVVIIEVGGRIWQVGFLFKTFISFAVGREAANKFAG